MDDLELHVVLVPVSEGSSDDILGCEIGPLNVSQRNLLVAVSEDTVKMIFNQTDELMVGLEAAPFELGLPSCPEPERTALVAVVPQTAKRLLEQMRFQKLRTGGEDIVERLPNLSPDTRSACQ